MDPADIATVYRYRDEILEGRDMGESARTEITALIDRLVEEYTAGDYVEEWDVDGLFGRVGEIFPTDELREGVDPETAEREELRALLGDEAMRRYDQRTEELGEELMGALERYLLLETIDQRWREHLYDMDYLREGIHLRGFAQIDPLVAYKNEGFQLFQDLMATIWGDFARMVFNVVVEVEGESGGVPQQTVGARGSSTGGGSASFSYGGGEQPSALALAAAGAGPALGADYVEEEDDEEAALLAPPVEQRRVSEDEQIGRNDPCWCGSGKKYKRCHGA